MRNDSHIIQQQKIEIQFENFSTGIGIQNEIIDLFYHQLLPKMEALFDELAAEKYLINIEHLEIDCGLLTQQSWQEEFVEKALRQLRKELLVKYKKSIPVVEANEAGVTIPDALHDFLFFLERGYLPWNSRIKTVAGLEQRIVIEEYSVSELKKLITKQVTVAERLAFRFSELFISKTIAVITQKRKAELDEIYSIAESFYPVSIDRQTIHAGILKAFSATGNENITHQFLSYLLSKADENSQVQSAVTDIEKCIAELYNENKESTAIPENKENKQPERQNKKAEAKPDNAIYISNAGLVLLHPFLPILFEEIKLTKENNWTDKLSQSKATLALDFLATGNNEFEECNLVLNKVLCGMNSDEVMIAEPYLTKETQDECEALLAEVIRHWSILKNTSIAGLRETFLQRNGKLSRVDNGWLLQVEQKAVDILLNQLPWGIGIIGLPWMTDMLYVEWA